MDIRVYTLEELEAHIQAINSHGDLLSPLSPLRLLSYLNNPRAKPGDPVLFELRLKEKLVAYRSLLPDSYFDPQGNAHRFAWLSGNWVDPELRRKGLSTLLLQEVDTRWEGRLMYTNYAPASKAVYDRTDLFPLLVERKGKRFYLRAAAEELLGERLGSRQLLRFGDHAANLLLERKLRKFEPVDKDRCRIEQLSGLDHENGDLINRLQKPSLFRRDVEIFNWILNYPWVTEDTRDELDYHFSYQSERFENILLAFTLPDQSRGLLWLVMHNQAMSVPYLWTESDLLYPFMARTVIHYMISKDCAYTTIRHAALTAQLSLHKKLFLSVREIPQLIFAHKAMRKQVPCDREIQDGDGDVVFTG
ncbi:MAG: GNAT family N-acetyltransferase [Bacteroidota bacterium]